MIYRGYFKSHFSEGLKLLAALIIYFLITTDGFMTATIRTASILLVVFSWLFAPLVFNTFPFRENILSDIYSMNDWIAAGSYVPDNQSNEKEKPNTNVVNSTNIQEEFKNEKAEDEFPNPSEYVEIGLLSEAENRGVSFPEKATKKKKAKKLLYFKDASPEIPSQKKKKSSREESIVEVIVAPPKIELKYTPWTLWFYEDILGELKITNNMKEPNMFKWILIKLIYFVWDFAPFALMFIAPISWPAIVFILILIIYMISMLVAHRLIAAEYRRMCILLTFWGCFFLLGYYYYYSDATLVDVLVSLILFFVMVVAIETLIREIVFPLGRTVVKEIKGRKNFAMKNVAASDSLPLLPQAQKNKQLSDQGDKDYKESCRRSAKYMSTSFLRVVPYICLLILGLFNLFLSLFPSLLISIHYNSR